MDLEFDAQIQWYPFFLDRTLPVGGKHKLNHYEQKFGKERITMSIAHLQDAARKVGIDMQFGGMIADTMKAHRLVEFAVQQGGIELQDKLMELMFDSYLVKNENMGDNDVLLRLSNEAGVTGAADLLSGDDLTDEVNKLVREKTAGGNVSAVPHFIIDGEHHLSGSQEADVFMNLFNKCLTK